MNTKSLKKTGVLLSFKIANYEADGSLIDNFEMVRSSGPDGDGDGDGDSDGDGAFTTPGFDTVPLLFVMSAVAVVFRKRK